MNLAHLHLVMNHVPTLGAVVALGLLLLAFIRRNEHLKHAGLEVLFIIAVLTLPVYVSGVAAHYEMRERTDISVDAVRIHQDAALIGFTVMEFADSLPGSPCGDRERRGRAREGSSPRQQCCLLWRSPSWLARRISVVIFVIPRSVRPALPLLPKAIRNDS
jgi:hypothetical protein